MNFLQERDHFSVPHTRTTWSGRLTIPFAFHFRCFVGFCSGESIPSLAGTPVSQIIPFDHAFAMASDMDVMEAHLPVIQELDGALIDFSEYLLLLHSYILSHAKRNGR
jgi:hypothetical protein